MFYKEGNISLLDLLITNNHYELIKKQLLMKKNADSFADKSSNPMILYPLVLKIDKIEKNQKNQMILVNKILDIEKNILKRKEFKNFSLTDFLKKVVSEKNTSIFKIPVKDGELLSLKFMLDNIANKNWSGSFSMKEKNIKNDLFLFTALIMSGELKVTKNISDENYEIIKNFNAQISMGLLKKIIQLNTFALGSIFDEKININANKLFNILNATICIMELNQDDKEFMKLREVDKCLTLIGNKKIFEYISQAMVLSSDEDTDNEKGCFEETRRLLMEKRMNAILSDNNLLNIEEFRKRKKI